MTNTTKPTVDMPATYIIGSDRYAGTIALVSPSGSYVIFQHKAAHMGSERFNRNTSGTYQAKGGKGGFLRLGEAEDYRDPSF